MRFWVANCDTTAMCRQQVGPAIFVRICGWSTSQISKLKIQLINDLDQFQKLKLYNCVVEEVQVLVFGMNL